MIDRCAMSYPDALKALASEIARLLPETVLVTDYPMAEHTTMRVGGCADLAVLPESTKSLCEAARLCSLYRIPFAVLGRGSNLICADAGYRGVILSTERLKTITLKSETTIYAECGVTLNALADSALEAGLTGAEFLYGIPGSVGGGLTMNAGAYGGQMSDLVECCELFDVARNLRVSVPVAGCRYGYRSSIFLSDRNLIALSCTIRLSRGDSGEIRDLMRSHLSSRREKQPLEYPSSGSFFKRCEGYFTAKLIDEAGLKGKTVGGAQISEKHAGFLINRGGATCADILTLEEQVRSELRRRYGVEIEREVELLG